MTFRNYIMVHASWNVLQRIAVADSAAPTLFHIANGHNKRDGEGCSDLFIKGPEHTENKVKAYAQRLVDSMLEFHRSNEIGDSPESGHVKDALFSMLAQHFCLPYQIGPDLPEGKIPAQEFKVPLVLLLEELGARITGNTTSEEKAALSRVVCRVIRNVSENYAALRQFQKPFISLEKAQVDEMKQSFWLDAPVFSDTSHGTSPRVGFRIDPAIITEINDEYLTSFRFFGNKYKFQYCGFAIQDGLPYPLLEVLSKPGLSVDTDNPHAGKLFAEMRDGTLKEVTQ